MIKFKLKTLFLRLDIVAAPVKRILNSQLHAVVMVIERLNGQLKNNNKQEQALFTFRFRIIIVTEGSFSLTVSYMQCNKRKTKNALQVRKCVASE